MAKKKKTRNAFGTEKNELKKVVKKIPEGGREENLLRSDQEVLEALLKAFESGLTRIFLQQIKKEIKSKEELVMIKIHKEKDQQKHQLVLMDS